MKRLITAFQLLLLSCFVLQAAENLPQNDGNQLFNLASEQFNEKEYSGCFRTITTWLEESPNPAYMEVALFMQSVSSYELNRRETSVLLIDFIRKYPVSYMSDKALYLLGCSAMNAGEYKDALEFIKRCPESSLPSADLPEYRFRYAYCAMQLADYTTSKDIFTSLAGEESRFAAAASYFKTYIDYAEGKSEEASRGFNQFSGHDQFKETIPYFNAQLLYATGKNQEAIDAAKSLLETNPEAIKKTELLRILAAASFDIKKYTNSRLYYIDYLSSKPEVHNTDTYRIGVLNYLDAEYDRALPRLSTVANEESPLGQSAAYHIGMILIKKKDYNGAADWFDKACKLDFDKDTKEKSFYNLAILKSENDSVTYDEKINTLKQFISQYPSSELKESISKKLALSYMFAREYDKALDILNSIQNPDDKIKQNKSIALFMLGKTAYEQEKSEDALRFFRQAIEMSVPKSSIYLQSMYWKGETNYKLEKYQDALKDLKAFADAAESAKLKSYPSAIYGAGYASFKQKNYSESIKWFDKFIKLSGISDDERYTDALNRLGDCNFINKNYEKADKYYQDADKASGGSNDYSVYQKAYSYGLRKMYQQKYDLLKQFDARFPNSDRIDDALMEAGRACVSMKKNNLAIESFTRLLENYPASPLAPKAGIQIALINYNENNTQEAITAYKKVIEKYPGTEEANIALGDLKAIYVAGNNVSEYITYTGNLSNPINIGSSQQDSLTWFAAENLLMDGKNDQALKSFESYLVSYPNGAFASECHYHLGNLELQNDNRELAISHFTKVSSQSGNRYQEEAAEKAADMSYEDKSYEVALENYTTLSRISSTKILKNKAVLGMLRCNYNLNNHNQVIENAIAVISGTESDEAVKKEALYYRAKSYLSKGQDALAKADLVKISNEFKTATGAESAYLLSDLYFRQGSLKDSEKLVQKLIQSGSGQSYWLARGFILLADINIKNKDYFQAEQYLNSLKDNYKADDDISGMIETRLNEIAKKRK
jgi:TolA-binding protein